MPKNIRGPGGNSNKNLKSGSAAGLEENLKKALSEMLVLFLLRERERYINEIASALSERSGGRLNLVFPYTIIYRMIDYKYIKELEKRIAPDGRRRQYYRITPAGKLYLDQLLDTYRSFSDGVMQILTPEGGTDDE